MPLSSPAPKSPRKPWLIPAILIGVVALGAAGAFYAGCLGSQRGLMIGVLLSLLEIVLLVIYGRLLWKFAIRRYPLIAWGVVLLFGGMGFWFPARADRLENDAIEQGGRKTIGIIDGGVRKSETRSGGPLMPDETTAFYFLDVRYLMDSGSWTSKRFRVSGRFGNQFVKELAANSLDKLISGMQEHVRQYGAGTPEALAVSAEENQKLFEVLMQPRQPEELPSGQPLTLFRDVVTVKYLPAEPSRAHLVGGEPESMVIQEFGSVVSVLVGIGMLVVGIKTARENKPEFVLPYPPTGTAPLMIARGDQRSGPFSVELVREMLRAGELLPTDLAWRQGMGKWVPVGVLVGFKA